MLVTNIFLSQAIIGKYGKNLTSGRKVAEENKKYKESIQATN